MDARPFGALAEEVLAHLLLQVLAGARVREVQAVLVHQHLLVLEPRLPRLLGDAFVELAAQLAGVRRHVQAFGFLLQLDAIDNAGHHSSFTNTFERRS
jgi:hypothetical protein